MSSLVTQLRDDTKTAVWQTSYGEIRLWIFSFRFLFFFIYIYIYHYLLQWINISFSVCLFVFFTYTSDCILPELPLYVLAMKYWFCYLEIGMCCLSYCSSHSDFFPHWTLIFNILCYVGEFPNLSLSLRKLVKATTPHSCFFRLKTAVWHYAWTIVLYFWIGPQRFFRFKGRRVFLLLG